MEPNGGSVFLTSLNIDKRAASKQAKREELLEMLECGPKILELHEAMQAQCDEMYRKVEDKLTRNEEEYMSNVRVFMETKRAAADELQRNTDGEKAKQRRDLKIRELECELGKTMDVALKLDSNLKNLTDELTKWKGKAEALEDDRHFLEDKVKAMRESNTRLWTSVKKAEVAAIANIVSGQDLAGMLGEASVPETAQPVLMEDSQQSTMRGSLSRDLDKKYRDRVQRLKHELAGERQLVMKMRTINDHQFGEPSQFEVIFLSCVDDMKADIFSRRKQQAEGTIRGTSRLPQRRQISSTTDVSLEDFTVADRRRVIEMLLSRDEVIEFLHNRIYPQSELECEAGQ